MCRDCFFIFEAQTIAQKDEKCPNCHKHRIICHPNLDKLSIAHIDCDAFYAAIHKRDDKSLINQPVIIGGGKRGVVSTACYIARSYGVRSAMPMFQAMKLCPKAVVIKPDIQFYAQTGKIIKNLMRELTPIVHSVSIDEAYLDLSGTERLHKAAPCQSLARLALKIENEVGITVSIGLSENRFLAKTASDMDKPRGFFALSKADVPKIIWPKNIGFLHGVGPATVKKLEKLGLITIEQLAHIDERAYFKEFGPNIVRLKKMANGEDERSLETETKRKSISSETTFFDDVSDAETLATTLKKLADRVAREARQKKIAGRTVTLKLKTAKFVCITRQISLSEPTQTAKTMFETVKPLLDGELKRAPFRLIGIGISELCDEEMADRGDLINQNAQKNLRLEKALDKIIDKFGKDILGTKKLGTPKKDIKND